ARTTDAFRIENVSVSPFRADELPTRDRSLEGCHISAIRSLLHKYDQEMAGIALGFLGKRIAGDEGFPLVGGSDNELRLETEMLRCRVLEHAFQLFGRATVTAEHQVAALQQGRASCMPSPASSSRKSPIATLLWPPTFTAR